MNIIDLHCDTASKIYYSNIELFKNNESIDINKLKKGNISAEVFAHFIDLKEVKNPFEEFIKMNEKFKCEIEKNSDYIEIVRNTTDLARVNNKGKVGAFLSIEEGEVLEGKIDRVKTVYDLGVRIITLTWNYKNSIGYPNKVMEYRDKGLTKVGKEIVAEMEYYGIVPDCSHLSDKGFYDLIDICKKPFIASHSNARYITNHSRNLTDDMIKLLADKGGVMGLNFCSDFIGKDKVTKIENMIYHLKHIRNVGGVDIISLGTDYDGIDNEVEIKDISEMYKLNEALKKSGFSENDIEKIFNKNALRVLSDILI